MFLSIYWVNHRNVFRFIRVVDDAILWSNLALLFLLALVPFGAAYMGQTDLAPFAVAADAGLMLAGGCAFYLLRSAIGRHLRDPKEAALFNQGRVRWLNLAALAVYAAAIPAAYVSPLLSLGMNFAVTLIYITPYARPEL